jgi:hypothetical protein
MTENRVYRGFGVKGVGTAFGIRVGMTAGGVQKRVGTAKGARMAAHMEDWDAMTGPPKAVGLYDPAYEKDACGIGFIADLKRRPTRETVVVRLFWGRCWGLSFVQLSLMALLGRGGGWRVWSQRFAAWCWEGLGACGDASGCARDSAAERCLSIGLCDHFFQLSVWEALLRVKTRWLAELAHGRAWCARARRELAGSGLVWRIAQAARKMRVDQDVSSTCPFATPWLFGVARVCL